MARFVKGDVVVVPFPFSDLSQAKRRPALVVAQLTGDDLILLIPIVGVMGSKPLFQGLQRFLTTIRLAN